MSVFTIKSKVIANRDAAPPVLTDPILGRSAVLEAIGVENLPTTADVASKVILLSVPSGARLSSLEYLNAGIGTSALDIAVWFPTVVPVMSSVVASRLISSSAFASNIAGVDNGTIADGLGTVAQNAIAKRSQPLWQQLGLLTDPLIDLDLGFSVRTTNSIAGYVGLRARYTR